MLKSTFSTLLLLLSFSILYAEDAPTGQTKELPDRSLTVSFGGTWVYKDTFGGLAPAVSSMIIWNYHLSEDYHLGINFLRFEYHPGVQTELKTFAYGFTFQHYWKQKWGITTPWAPYAAYSILLSQAFRGQVEGRAIGHNTRIALGSEYRISDLWRIGLEGVWNFVQYPQFGGIEDGYQSLGANLTTRWLL